MMIPSITSHERDRNSQQQRRRARRWKIDGTLLPLKLHYFFKDAGCSVILPFIPVIGRQIGISPFNVGLFFSIAAILTLFIKPWVKLIPKQRSVFIISIFCTLLCLLCFTIFPTQEIAIARPVQFECGFGSNYIKQCQRDIDQLRPSKLPLVCPTTKQVQDILGENYTTSLYNNNTSSIVREGERDILERFSDLMDSVQHYARGNLHLFYPDVKHKGAATAAAVNSKPAPAPATSTAAATKTTENPKFPEEICYINCDGIDHIQMQHFCKTFNGPRLPETCHTMEQGIDETAEIYEEKVLGSFYYVMFEAKLKMNFVTDGNCLFLPMDKISFKTRNPNPNASNITYNNEDKPEELDQLPFEKFSCTNKTIFPHCIANCPKSVLNLNSYLEQFVPSEHSLFSEHVIFWFYAIVLVFGFVSLAIFNGITDSYCYKLVGNNPETFCVQRLWGLVGFGLFCLLSAYFVDKVSAEAKIMKNYATCFFLAAGLFVMDLIVSIKLEIKEAATNYEPIWKDLQFLLKDPRLILFTIDCLIIGTCSAIHKCFLLWHIEELNEKSAICSQASEWIKTIQGLMIAVLCFSEVMFFSVAGWLLNKFGHFNCVSLVFLMSAIQFAMYSLLSHPWSFVPLELFQGIILSIFSVAMCNYGGSAVAQIAARQNSQPKVDQFFSTSFSIIGMCVGSILGGYLFEEMGGKFTFLMVALSCLVSFCIHVALVYCLHKYNMESYGRPVTTGNLNVNEQKMKRISRTDSEEFHFDFESDID